MPTVKLLEETQMVEALHAEFCKKIRYEVPLGYFLKGDCYGFLDGDRLVGGFCLVHDLPWKLRSLQQVPGGRGYGYEKFSPTNTAEFTGYCLSEKKHGLYFTLKLVRIILAHRAEWFVYSYPVSQKNLESYYAKGNPVRIYTGAPTPLPGHTSDMEPEHVEAVSKKGIVKIFLARTLRYIFKK